MTTPTPPPRRRGPSPGPVDAAHPQPVVEVEIPVEPLRGIECPGCGKGIVPIRDRTTPEEVYGHCSLCPARFVLTFEGGRAVRVRLIRA
jgi:hypothetical protein